MISGKTHLLIVDDDKEIRDLLADLLTQYGYEVTTAKDGVEMMEVFDKDRFHLMILDVLLPGEDGFALCCKIRQFSSIPIIMLTAIGEDTDRIVGLELGADDYIAKPFNPRELIARIKATLRRAYELKEGASEEADRTCVLFEGWTLHIDNRKLISSENVEVTLSTGEFDLLKALTENAQKVLSRDQLLDITRNREAGPFDRSIDVQISRLRHKIEENPKNPKLIKTVRGGGYMFTPKVKRL